MKVLKSMAEMQRRRFLVDRQKIAVGVFLLLVPWGLRVAVCDENSEAGVRSMESPWRLHTLFSVECNPYFDWQSLGLMHSLRKAGQPGLITRLLSCTEEEAKKYRNFDIAPTHVVPSMTVHPITGDVYPAINKPAGVLHWLTHSKDAQSVDWVIILDADMIMRRPVIPWELGAQPGKPVAAYYGYLIGCESDAVLALAHTRHPELCDKVGGLFMHHIDDLRAVAPLWLSKTEEVRADSKHYATNYTGDIYEHGWISEMYGYVYGAAEVGLRHRVDDDIMIYPGYTPREGVDPFILHYGITFNVGSWQFGKSDHRADSIADDCNRLFPAPPFPKEVESITKDEGARRAHYLSIECINTINEGLLLHHAKRGCPKPHKTAYLEFLLGGWISGGQSRPHMSKFSIQRNSRAGHVTQEEDHVASGVVKNPRIHTLFSVECDDYFDWQTLGLYHSFQLSGQPGFITRLLSCKGEKLKTYRNLDLAPTHIVPSYTVHPLSGDEYTAINKPAAVYHWLHHVKMDVEYVVILDADMILRRPITPWELGASKGHPVAASYEYLIGCDNELAKLHTQHAEYCQKVGGVIVIHIDDLRLLAPLWLHKTEEVRADKAHWATNFTGDVYGNGWISEMYGYAFGAAELKLRHIVNKEMMLYPGYIPADGVEPRVLHYGLGFKIGNWSWDKHTWHYSDMTSACWKVFPFPPVPDRLVYPSREQYVRDLLNFECIGTLNEALLLYHKRKGCKEAEKERQLQSVLRKWPSFTSNRSTEERMLDTKEVVNSNLTGIEVLDLKTDGVQEVTVHAVNLTKTLPSKSNTTSDRNSGRVTQASRFSNISSWVSFVILVLLALLLLCFRRRPKGGKQRTV